MPSYYISKTTGQLTQKQYDQDPRTGTLITNTPAPLGMIQAAGAASQAGSTQVGQHNVQNYQLAALRGEYGPDAMRQAQYQVGMQTGRSIGGQSQPDEPPGARVEFGAIGPVPEGRKNPAPSVTYYGTQSQRREAAEQNIRAENLVRKMNVDPDSFQAETIRAAYFRPGFTPEAEGLDPISLEKTRQEAESAGMTRREGQYGNLLQQWAQNRVEIGSSYHYLGKRSGVAVPANPYEYQADLAVEFLKGKPQRSSEWFSPVSGEESQYLPGGFYGIQEMYWDKALARDRGQGEYIAGMPTGNLVQTRTQIDPLTSITGWSTSSEQASFIPAIQHIQMAEGRYGPYGQLFGGDRYVGTPSSSGLRMQDPFVFTAEAMRNVDAAIRLSAMERSYTPGLRAGAPGPALTLTGRSISYGDIKAYAEAEGLGRLRGSGMVAGSPVITDLPGQVNTGQNANQLNSFARKCNAAPQAASTGVIGGSVTTVTTTLPAPFISSPNQSKNPFFEGASKAISGFPILGDFYRMGASVDKRTVNAIQIAVSTPFFKSVSRGGEVFAAMKDYESYPSFTGPAQSAGMRYKSLAAGFIGAETNEQMQTAGIAAPFLSLGKGYREGISQPAEKLIGKGIVQSAVMGLVDVPGSVPDMIGMSIVGGERTVKNIGNFPGLAAAGGAMAADSFIRDPVRFGAGLVGTYGLFRAGGMVTQKGIGLVRSRGMEHIPIEQFGYDAKYGYPLKPASGTSGQLIESFYKNELIPEPTQMSAGKTPTSQGIAPPYLHGKGGVPSAKLPTTPAGDPLLWTVHDSNQLARGVKVGEAYKMTGTGTSELDSISAAPVAEGYFGKVGGMIPESIGFSSPFKTPTIYATTVQGLETIPGKLKAALPRDAAGKVTDYTVVNEYMQKRLTAAPGGQAFVPMLKGEFEANIATNSIFEVTGRKYYTKLGGIGEKQWFGTRVPIVEQGLIGFEPAGTKPLIKSTGRGSSYRPADIGGYSLIGSLGISMGYGGYSKKPLSPTSSRSPTALDSGASSRRTPVSSKPFSGSSAGKRLSSSIAGLSSASTSKKMYSPSELKGSSGLSSVRPSSISPVSRSYTPPPYSSTLTGISTPFTSSTTTKRPPITPPPTTIITPPVFGGMFGSGSRQGYTPRRNWRAENLVTSLEYLSQGFPGTFGKTTRKKAKRKGRK